MKKMSSIDMKGMRLENGRKMATELSEGYTSEVESMDEEQWCKAVGMFDDANIYQTTAYKSVPGRRRDISRLVLRRADAISALAQVRIIRVPVVGVGFAYVRWGPIWRLGNDNRNSGTFRQIVRALRNEYALKRGLVVRLRPRAFTEDADDIMQILREEGYEYLSEGEAKRTLILDLKPELGAIRKGLKQNWRNHLNQAERNQLKVVEGNEDDLFEKFIGIYREMLSRKRFVEPNDIKEFRSMQKVLPTSLKMRTFISMSQGKPSAGAICSAIGDTGVYLFGATNDAGMSNKGSYLVQWKVIQWMKALGIRWYDLHGINPDANPGTYSFKNGLCGRNGKEVLFIGQYETCERTFESILAAYADKARLLYRRLKAIVAFM